MMQDTPGQDLPVIDVHHHLWDLSMGRHPWLKPDGSPASLGDLAYLRHDYLPADVEADAAGLNVAGTICIEALWDQARDPFEEIEWFESLPRRGGIAARYVAGADLAAPGAEARIARLGAHPRVAGVRQTIRWHPDARLRWTESARMDDPAWLGGVRMLAEHGLVLEFLMYPWQADAVFRFAEAHPNLVIVLNHCSSPIDRDAPGLARWRDGLATMAQAPNVNIKLSNIPSYAGAPTIEATRTVTEPILAAFGPGRCLWGSDYPVGRRHLPYGEGLTLFRGAISDLPHADQAAILNGNARRIYKLDEVG